MFYEHVSHEHVLRTRQLNVASSRSAWLIWFAWDTLNHGVAKPQILGKYLEPSSLVWVGLWAGNADHARSKHNCEEVAINSRRGTDALYCWLETKGLSQAPEKFVGNTNCLQA
eukprot:3844217-Amphidinium_carterae.4